MGPVPLELGELSELLLWRGKGVLISLGTQVSFDRCLTCLGFPSSDFCHELIFEALL